MEVWGLVLASGAIGGCLAGAIGIAYARYKSRRRKRCEHESHRSNYEPPVYPYFFREDFFKDAFDALISFEHIFKRAKKGLPVRRKTDDR